MVVRRNDARRRRLVIDPAVQTDDATVSSDGVSVRSPKNQATISKEIRAYAFGADRRGQRKTTDLIPKRLISFLLVILLLLTVVGLINWGYSQSSNWESRLGLAGVQVFDIAGPGSLASWFSSFLLIITGLASLQIYALRQHRCNDYRGTYRLWVWMAAIFLVASVGCVVNLESIASSLSSLVVPDSVGGRDWISHAVKLFAFSLIFVRGVYEVKESRGSLALVVFVWVAYCTATIMRIPATERILVQLDTRMMAGNCFLVATVSLLVAHLHYARFVFLQAHGLIHVRVKKKKSKPEAKSASKTNKTNPNSKTKNHDSEKTGTVPVTAKSQADSNSTAKKKTANKSVTAKKHIKSGIRVATTQTTTTQPNLAPTGKQKSAGKSAKKSLQEMAAASRAKSTANQQSSGSAASDETQNDVNKPSKAQRRKLRKAEKQRRRAA